MATFATNTAKPWRRGSGSKFGSAVRPCLQPKVKSSLQAALPDGLNLYIGQAVHFGPCFMQPTLRSTSTIAVCLLKLAVVAGPYSYSVTGPINGMKLASYRLTRLRALLLGVRNQDKLPSKLIARGFPV